MQGSLTSAVWMRERYLEPPRPLASGDPNATDVTLYEYGRLSVGRSPTAGPGGVAQAYVSARWRRYLTDIPLSYRVGDDTRLYEAYVDLSSLPGLRHELRLGRQYLPDTVGFWGMDGARLRRRFGRHTATVYGGVGAPSWQFDTSDAGLAGMALELRGPSRFRARVGTLIALSGARPRDVDSWYITLGADTWAGGYPLIHPARGLPRSLTVDLAYEPLYRRVARASVIARIGSERWTASGGFRFDVPQFPPDSVFRVFAFEATREASLSAEARLTGPLAVGVRHIRQVFDDGAADRDRIEAAWRPGGEQVARLGVEWLRWAEARRRYAYIRLQKQITPYLALGAGNALQTYRLVAGGNDLFSRAPNAEARLLLGPNCTLAARVERNTNRHYRKATRAFAYLRTSFATETGGGP